MPYSTLYVTATGQILESGETVTSAGGGQAIYSGYGNALTQYLPSGVLTTRPVVTEQTEYTIKGNGTDTVTLPLPSGTLVTDQETGTQYTSSGVESLIVTSTIGGVFQFVIDPPFPYRPLVLTVTVNAYF